MSVSIVLPETYSEWLQEYSIDELKKEYEIKRNNLTKPYVPQTLLEYEPGFYIGSEYKMQMFNSVVKEIARRCEQAKTIKELTEIADKFFSNNTTKFLKNKNKNIKKRQPKI